VDFDILNGLLILICLVLGTAGIALLAGWVLRRFKWPVSGATNFALDPLPQK